MDLELARRFLLEFLPSDGQIPINDVIQTLKVNPGLILNNGLLFNHLNYFKCDNKQIAVAAANGVLCGIALAYGTKFPEVSKMMEDYLETAQKSRGENVVNFLQKKR